MGMSKKEISEYLSEMADKIRKEGGSQKTIEVLDKAVILTSEGKQKAVWKDKKYCCPVCDRVLNPSFQKECPDCNIKIVYKKSKG